jgi:S-formylglutathione hydrolase FrmB
MLDRRQFLLALATATAVAARPALAAAAEVVEAAHWSPRLGRTLPYLASAVGAPGPGAPVVYLLHGHGGSEWDWLSAGRARETALGLVEAGVLPPLHLVTPGVGNSWYVDGPEPHGPVATVLLDEVMPTVERALAVDPEQRAIVGLSMGGFGALHLGLRDPGQWRFIGALSPAIFTPGNGFSDLQLHLFSGAFGQPFDADRFAAADPFALLPGLARASPPPAFYLSCGADDYFGLDDGTRAFGAALAAAGVPATVRIEPGRHDWTFWRAELPEALTALGQALRRLPQTSHSGATAISTTRPLGEPKP